MNSPLDDLLGNAMALSAEALIGISPTNRAANELPSPAEVIDDVDQVEAFEDDTDSEPEEQQPGPAHLDKAQLRKAAQRDAWGKWCEARI